MRTSENRTTEISRSQGPGVNKIWLWYIGNNTNFGLNTWEHWLQTPNEAFFHWNPELLGFGRQTRQINSGVFWGILSDFQHPFWYSESLVHVFHYSTIISTKKLSL
jgi:hypothetical protein